MLARLCILLLLGVVVSACLLVHMQHQRQRLTFALEREQRIARNLESEQRGLRNQIRSLGTAVQLEHIARTQLHMHEADSRVTVYAAEDTKGQAATTAPLVGAP